MKRGARRGARGVWWHAGQEGRWWDRSLRVPSRDAVRVVPGGQQKFWLVQGCARWPPSRVAEPLALAACLASAGLEGQPLWHLPDAGWCAVFRVSSKYKADRGVAAFSPSQVTREEQVGVPCPPRAQLSLVPPARQLCRCCSIQGSSGPSWPRCIL